MVATLSAAILSYRSYQHHRTDILMATTRSERKRVHVYIFVAIKVDDENLDALAQIGFWLEDTAN